MKMMNESVNNFSLFASCHLEIWCS